MADKHASSGGIFIRLTGDGDKVIGAFCGEPFPREVVWTGDRYETFDPDVHTDKRPSLRVMINFYVPAEQDMKVIEGGTVWFKDVLKVRDKYGLDKWLFEVERHGEAGDPKTTYTILPEEKLDDAHKAEIAGAGLHDLGALVSVHGRLEAMTEAVDVGRVGVDVLPERVRVLHQQAQRLGIVGRVQGAGADEGRGQILAARPARRILRLGSNNHRLEDGLERLVRPMRRGLVAHAVSST